MTGIDNTGDSDFVDFGTRSGETQRQDVHCKARIDACTDDGNAVLLSQVVNALTRL